jgi:hypothetical protein
VGFREALRRREGDADTGEAAGSICNNDGCNCSDGGVMVVQQIPDGGYELGGVGFAGELGLAEDFGFFVMEAGEGDGAEVATGVDGEKKHRMFRVQLSGKPLTQAAVKDQQVLRLAGA